MKILSSKQAFEYLRHRISYETEEFWMIALSSGKTIRGAKCLFRGTVDACLVHPRDIFRFAYQQNASSFLIAHSHPSGDPAPSLADIAMTQKIYKASRFLEVGIIDHLVLTEQQYFSFADEHLKPFG